MTKEESKDEYTNPYDNLRFGLITGILAVVLMFSIYLLLK